MNRTKKIEKKLPTPPRGGHISYNQEIATQQGYAIVAGVGPKWQSWVGDNLMGMQVWWTTKEDKGLVGNGDWCQDSMARPTYVMRMGQPNTLHGWGRKHSKGAYGDCLGWI
eukprot:EG_transcript_24583